MLLIFRNVPYILKTKLFFAKFIKYSLLFFLLTNCWQPAAGTDVHFFQLQLALMQNAFVFKVQSVTDATAYPVGCRNIVHVGVFVLEFEHLGPGPNVGTILLL